MEFDQVSGDQSPVNTKASCFRPDGIPGLSSLTLPGKCSQNSPCLKNLFSTEPTAVLSPVTNLALNMTNLAVIGSQCDTPKRKAHAPLLKIPSFASDTSSDAGLGMDSPSPLDPADVEESFERAILEAGKVIKDSRMPIRRNNSLPLQLLGSSPALKGRDPEPRCFGIFSRDRDQPDTGHGNKENVNSEEGFEFKKPAQPVSRCRLRSFHSGESKEAFARRPNSAPALMMSPPPVERLCSLDDSPVTLRRSSLTSSLDDDDGFLDVLDDAVENESDMPMGMASLLTAPLVREKMAEETDSPIIRCRPRGLFRSPSLPSSTGRAPLKRAERPLDENTPVRVKRRRSLAGSQVSPAKDSAGDENNTPAASRLAQRSKSFCQTNIERLLDSDIKGLSGDFTKPLALPTVEGKHQDLKYITSEMMVAALNGKFNHMVERMLVIDCRYPYEFEGGHIKGALNLHQEEQVEEYLLKTPIVPSSPEKRVLLVFHCEFSSERGPRMCRFLRERDRAMNEYPNLHYPELYVLKGGYKEFFPDFQTQCEPQAYRPMHHEDFKEDLRKFRLKSRTWAGERSKRDLYSRLKKL
ncbi:M-phase inducer phosphatase 2 isoform X1 [Megalops cyprinoides]|uniref:M-phase inducer phosphatase 2 isoform X1 n=1 Tax=Megalops cyprinoides TaxID=118141 RepID=UPI0018649F95|nr:M-phase inducer phosphatase 2 isoform X1 [Megalops cyprinoides]